MAGSRLRALKDAIPIPGPVVLVVAGLACYGLTCAVLRQPLSWGWALVPGLLLSLAIESWEIWDHYGARGFGGASITGVVGRHLQDVALMNAAPVIVCVVASLRGAFGPPVPFGSG